MKTYKHYYIYLTTNLVNGKKYLGKHSTNNLNNSYLGSGTVLRQAVKKYGKENFKKEILEFCDSHKKAYQKEIYWCKKLNVNKSKNFYNLTDGGEGSIGKKMPEKQKLASALLQKGKFVSEETKRKISRANKGKLLGRIPWHKGRTGVYSKEVLKIMSLSHKGYKHSNETKKKMSEQRKGVNNPNFGKKMSEEQKLKISKANKGRKYTEEVKKKMSKTRKGRISPMFGKVHSEETKNKMSKQRKGKQHKKVTCPHCGKVGGITGMMRYHFDNCKLSSNYNSNKNIITCPYCEKIGGIGSMKQFHFNNCKFKKE